MIVSDLLVSVSSLPSLRPSDEAEVVNLNNCRSLVFSMLTAFGVLDTRNRLVWSIGDFLYRVTEPALRPIRNFLPNFGGIDISPMIALLLIQFILVPLVAALQRGILFGSWQLFLS